MRITPAKLCGSIKAPPSKSYAHRLIIASMLSDKKTLIHTDTLSDDIKATLSCVEALGGRVDICDNGIEITPALKKGSAFLDCGESGTTARILLPVCCALNKNVVLSGRGRLPERPFSEIVGCLEKNGAVISSDKMPISVSGKIKSGNYEIAGNVSSQYISGLLYALPLLNGDSRITLTTELQSSAYTDMTIEVLKGFGIEIIKEENGFFVKSGKFISCGEYNVCGDWSNSAFWIAANALGCNISVTGLDENSTQGDKKIKDLLLSDKTDVSEIPDLFPILAVLAAGRKGETLLYNAERLRIKESDRIEATSSLIESLGGKTENGRDYLKIFGSGELRGGIVNSFNDHRIVMSAAIASVICKDDVIINGYEAVNKSYPDFFEKFEMLGGKVNVF